MGEHDGGQGAGEEPVHGDAAGPLLHFRRPRHGHGELIEVHDVVAVGVHGGEELVDGVVEDEDAELLQRRPQPRADDGGLAVCRGAGGGMSVEGPTEVRGVLAGEEGTDVGDDLLREACTPA